MQHDSLDWSIEPIEYESSSFDKNGNEVPFQALYAKVLPIINGVPLDKLTCPPTRCHREN